MPNIYSKLSSNDFLIICIVIGVLAFLLIILTIIDVIKNRRNNIIDDDVESIEEDILAYTENISKDDTVVLDEGNNNEPNPIEETLKLKPLNINKPVAIEEIKYVEDDEELEKERAKIELQALKDELKRKEAELQEFKSQDELVENVPVEEVSNEATQVLIDLEDISSEEREKPIDFFEDEQEQKAIISIEELKNAVNNAYSDEEMYSYEDEGNEPISIQELEQRYRKEEIININAENITIDNEKKFQNSPLISPVFGIKINEDSLELEQTADLEKLNEEIRKTNEFLMVLKDLKKNLE